MAGLYQALKNEDNQAVSRRPDSQHGKARNEARLFLGLV
jgi:hypothetical protein